MSITTQADLANVINNKFLDGLFLANTENNAFVQSGIMVTNQQLQSAISGQGITVKIDRLNDLSGDEEVQHEGTDATVNGITGTSDVAVRLLRRYAAGATIMAQALSAKDPIGFAISRISAFQTRQTEKALISALKGVFGISGFTSNTLDISGLTGDNAVISANSIIDATYKLGDRADELTAIAMHSAVKAKLEKLNLVTTTIRQSDMMPISYYGKMRVITDDSLSATSGVYTTYLFAPGAVAYAETNPQVYDSAKFALEVDHNAAQGNDTLYTNRNYIVHPMGFKYKGTITPGTGVSNTNLSTSSNWEKVYTDGKHIGIVQFKHKI